MTRRFDPVGIGLTAFTLLAATLWAFPLYWAVITTLKPEHETIRPGVHFLPEDWTLGGYIHIIQNTNLGTWYVNSIVTAVAVTVLVVVMSAACGFAISQLRFPGRRLLYLMILASFMVPMQALIVTHFILMNDFGLVNTWTGIILPQLIAPISVIVYKQFFDSVPKELREAAIVDGANWFQLLFRVFLPMNWGITTALAIITFIAAWNNFLWPFLVTTSERTMTITVGITQVKDAFGVYYARQLSGAVLAALPVAAAYLIFQRRVTQAIMLTAGIKG